MQKPKVRVLVVSFVYGGNGGISSTIPELAQWTTKTVIKMKEDERIEKAVPLTLSDTPITATRNRAVKIAREKGCDMILMLDSDNEPDGYLGHDPRAVPFWDTAFDFAYDRLVKGIPTCIAAPYCGPPPHPVEKAGMFDAGEVPYLFQWTNKESHDPNAPAKLDILTRSEAAQLSGIYPVAALPTGCCLFTTNCFDGPPKPYFKYEWMDEDQSEKASTEDVYATRNISLYWSIKKGIDVCFATCDSWALHYKPKKVGKPFFVPVEAIAKNMREALEKDLHANDVKVHVDFTEGLETMLPARGAVVAERPSDAPVFDISKVKRRWEKLGPEDTHVYISDEEWSGLAALEAPALVATEESRDPPPPQNDDTDLDDPTPITEPADDSYLSNGHSLRYKMVGQRKVAVLEHEIPDADIGRLEVLTSWLAKKLEGGIEVAVIHPGTGQGTAAILPCLPATSRVFAFDSVSQYGSGEYAKEFSRAFEKELESGQVKADVDSKRFPSVKNYKVDMAFFENFVTASKLEGWLKAVSPRGVLAGCGFDTPETKAVVESFRTKHKLPIQSGGGLWVIPVGGIANAAK